MYNDIDCAKIAYYILRREGIKLYNKIYDLSMEFITTKNKILLDQIKELRKSKFNIFAFSDEMKELKVICGTKKIVPGFTLRYETYDNLYVYEKNK